MPGAMQIGGHQGHGRKGAILCNVTPIEAVRFHLRLLRIPSRPTSRPQTGGAGSGASSTDGRRIISPRPDSPQALRTSLSPRGGFKVQYDKSVHAIGLARCGRPGLCRTRPRVTRPQADDRVMSHTSQRTEPREARSVRGVSRGADHSYSSFDRHNDPILPSSP
jgi:hypothetical protein